MCLGLTDRLCGVCVCEGVSNLDPVRVWIVRRGDRTLEHYRSLTHTPVRRLGSSQNQESYALGMWGRHSWGWKLESGREEGREAGESHILDLCSVSVVPDLCSGSLCGSGCPSL